jgi:hypothetical protein
MIILISFLELSTEPDKFPFKIRETICVVKVGILVIIASIVTALLKSPHVRLFAEAIKTSTSLAPALLDVRHVDINTHLWWQSIKNVDNKNLVFI